MMVSRDERGQILILLATWLFFGGGASGALIIYDRSVSEMKQAVEHVVADGSRKDVILSDISRWESIQEIQNEAMNDDRDEILQILRRKEAQRSELEPIISKLDRTFTAKDWDFLNLRFSVKQHVTSAEWAEIAARPNR